MRKGLPSNAVMTMIISCPNCGTRYAVPDTAIGNDGRTVRCAKCKHSWFQEPMVLDTPELATNSPVLPKSTRPASNEARAEPPRVPVDEPDASGEQDTPPEPAPPAREREPDAETAAALASVADALKGAGEDESVSDAPASDTSSVDETATNEPDAGDVDFDEEPVSETISDPLAEADTPADEFADEATPFDDDYESDYAPEEESDDEVSHFEYRAPFTARRNPLKMWSIAAAVFALMAAATIGAINYYGLPPGLGLPFKGPTFGIGKPDLVLDFPLEQQREETLATGVEIFRVRGTITNAGAAPSAVPRLVVVFVDDRNREVFSKIIVPAKNELAPGESLNVTEGISDYPEAARSARLGWAPN